MQPGVPIGKTKSQRSPRVAIPRAAGSTFTPALLVMAGCTGHGAVTRPTHPVGLDEAREYVLSLVNRDRREAGLLPVERDAVAEAAGQTHAEDMARVGYTAHWGSDGSVPEERYTLAGGEHLAQENAACFADGVRRQLDEHAAFSPAALEDIERAFMDERPPHDGHRRNILKDTHTSLGIGLAQPEGLAQPCMAQEFVDVRGHYDELPRTAKLGSSLRVSGTIDEPVAVGGVGLARIDPKRPMSAAQLNRTSSYPVPEPYVVYFPKGYQTPKPVEVDGNHFSIEVRLSHQGRPGRYEVSIWGRYPGAGNQLAMVSLRTIDVR